ncbi:hypothetical protein MLD38_037753 [Melastoma candidum]|uniref:Uncharacterized protein n=1 Tax=Melastoma candidum TaxID=119954 RepID=A0ACB9LNV4_9MYRT|nr:hypothetical protein MLD38_037753 [Melastoma candidum]
MVRWQRTKRFYQVNLAPASLSPTSLVARRSTTSTSAGIRYHHSSKYSPGIPEGQYRRSQHGDDILHRQDMPLSPDMVQDNYLVSPGGTPCHSSRSKHSPRLPIDGTVTVYGINIQDGKNTPHRPTFGIHSSESAARQPYSAEQFPEDLQEVVNNIPNCEPIWDDLSALVASSWDFGGFGFIGVERKG